MCLSNLIKQLSSQKPAVIFNEFVKSLKMPRSVIPAPFQVRGKLQPGDRREAE
jgi:hypothetical protein